MLQTMSAKTHDTRSTVGSHPLSRLPLIRYEKKVRTRPTFANYRALKPMEKNGRKREGFGRFKRLNARVPNGLLSDVTLVKSVV